MPYLSLYRKYRPQTFDEILGQEHVSATLANAISEDRVAHAYLFTGPRGTGKTSTARVLAKALNCEKGPTPAPCGRCESCIAITEGSSLDVIEIDAASHSKVEETREILRGVPLATAGGRKKVYVIDEVHMLSASAFNALLKTLEEPPDHVVFVLATTEPHKVLPTIMSRTQRFDFRPFSIEVLEEQLAAISKLEEVHIDPGAISVVARHANGSSRDALSALEQLASLGGAVTEEETERLLGFRSTDAMLEIFDAVAAGDVSGVFLVVNAMVAQGGDPRQLAYSALGHVRSLLLVKSAPDAQGLLDVAEEDAPALVRQAGRFSTAELLRTLDLLGKSITEMRNAPNHRLLLEIALVRAASPMTDSSADGLLGRIERLERRMGIEEDSGPNTRERSNLEAPQEVASPASDSGSAAGVPASAPPGGRGARVSPVASAGPVRRTADQGGPGAGAASDHIGLGHIKDAWPATMKEVSTRSKRVWGLLSPSRPLELENDTLLVEVQSPFHESSMTDERNRQVLADALHAALGIRPRIAFSTRGADKEPRRTEPTDEVGDYTDLGEGATDDPIELVKKGLSAEVVEEIGRP